MLQGLTTHNTGTIYQAKMRISTTSSFRSITQSHITHLRWACQWNYSWI